MEEGDQPVVGSATRFRVHELEAGRTEPSHRTGDVVRREGEVVDSFPPALDEASDHPVRPKRFQQLDPHAAGPQKSGPHAFRRDVLNRLGLQAQRPVEGKAVLQPLHRNAHVVRAVGHTSCRSRYVPNDDRSTSLISPSVAFPRAADRIAGMRFALDPAARSSSRRARSTALALRALRNARRRRTCSASSFGSARYSGTLPPDSIAFRIPPRRSTSRIRSDASDSSRSVRDSMTKEPAAGSIVFATPLSWARICCVRRASRTAFSEGSERASSMLFVCRDCAPPRTAASAWIATRTALFSGCWAVSATPAVCAWNRNASDSGFVAWNRSAMIEDHRRRAARNLAISSRRSMWALRKKEICGAITSISRPRLKAASR